MMTVAFPAQARALVDECLAQPYPSLSARGEAVAERDAWAGDRLVLIDVPTGVGADALVERVAKDARSGFMLRLRAVHNESSKDGGTRIVFTPAPEASLADLAEDLHASVERARLDAEADFSRVRAELSDQDVTVTLHDDDWFIVHDVLADAAVRRPADTALADAAQQVKVVLYGEEIQ